jgi:hypothetical protein
VAVFTEKELRERIRAEVLKEAVRYEGAAQQIASHNE